jgi:alkylation response protein AidB-like acyl-CoA dehydrogenase
MAVTSVNTFGLSEEQLLMRDSVLELLERVLPRDKIRQLDKTGEFPHEAFRALAKAGWLGIIYPEKYGGMGGSYKDLSVLIEAMAYHYGGIATAFLTTVIYAGMHVNLYAKPEVAAVRLRSPSLERGRTSRRSPPAQSATAIITSSTAPRCTSPARMSRDTSSS